MRIAISLLITCCIVLGVQAQSGPFLFAGTKDMANGQIGILADNAEAAIVLPAKLVDLGSYGWSVAGATRTGLTDFKEIAAAGHVRLPWKDQLGIGIQHAGIEGYNEQRVLLSYARALSVNWFAAVQFDLNRNSAEEYETIYAASWSFSMIAPLMKDFSMSAFIYNPMGQDGALTLPSVLRAGVKYEPSEKLSTAVEAEKDWRYEMRFKAGIVYKLHPKFHIRWGVSTTPSHVHAGVSWNLNSSMDLTGGWQYHSRLGSQVSASLAQSGR